MERIFSTNEFKVLNFIGNTGGVDLVPDFNLNEIRQKYFTLKRFKVVPYANQTSTETVLKMYGSTPDLVNPAYYLMTHRAFRLDKDFLLDNAQLGLHINFRINSIPLGIFATQNVGFPIDFDSDNIFSVFPEKLQDLTISLNASYNENYTDIASPNVTYRVKVIIEGYLTSYNPMTRLKEIKEFQRSEVI